MLYPWAPLALMLACLEMRVCAFSAGVHTARNLTSTVHGPHAADGEK